MSNPVESPLFRYKDQLTIPGITLANLLGLWGQLGSHYGLQAAQLVESASYSMAMVSRFALGQSAADGKVLTLATDDVSGWIAIATLRHLFVAGADGVIVVQNSPSPFSPEMSHQLHTAERLTIPVVSLEDVLADEPNRLIENCHMVLCGLFRRDLTHLNNPHIDSLTELLNEAATPVHSVEAPVGVDPDSGQPGKVPLYSSSTLSLAAPLAGLCAGKDFVGRHYVADASCPRELYQQFGLDATMLFAEQPVVQIVPVG